MEIIKSKRELSERYKVFFDKKDIKFCEEPENARFNYCLNAVMLKDRKERDKFLEFTNENGVMIRPIWELMNRLLMFKNCQVENMENVECLADIVVNM